jgi:hypothetical protein
LDRERNFRYANGLGILELDGKKCELRTESSAERIDISPDEPVIGIIPACNTEKCGVSPIGFRLKEGQVGQINKQAAALSFIYRSGLAWLDLLAKAGRYKSKKDSQESYKAKLVGYRNPSD